MLFICFIWMNEECWTYFMIVLNVQPHKEKKIQLQWGCQVTAIIWPESNAQAVLINCSRNYYKNPRSRCTRSLGIPVLVFVTNIIINPRSRLRPRSRWNPKQNRWTRSLGIPVFVFKTIIIHKILTRCIWSLSMLSYMYRNILHMRMNELRVHVCFSGLQWIILLIPIIVNSFEFWLQKVFGQYTNAII